MAAVEDKSAKIITWLQKKLGDKPITPYEVNTRTTEILSHLVECNEIRDHDVALVIDDLRLKTKETAVAANFLKDFLLESIGPSFTNLSRSGNSYVNELIESALLLEVKDTSLTSFILEINDLSSKLHEVENKNHGMECEILNMKKKFTEALALEKSLKEDLIEAEKQCAAQEEKRASRPLTLQFLEQKRGESVSRIQAAENSLAAIGDDPSLHHQSLVALSEKLSKLQAQSVPMRKKLESFMDLSPNLFIAQAKVDEARRELEAIEAEFAEKLNMAGSQVVI
ncbi:HAUS augmin-like complex subunit 1 [Lissotriton helveticus]